MYNYKLNHIAYAGNPAWIYVWLEENLVAQFGLLLVQLVSLVVCLISSCKGLDSAGPTLEKNGQKIDIWLTRLAVNNGMFIILKLICIAFFC